MFAAVILRQVYSGSSDIINVLATTTTQGVLFGAGKAACRCAEQRLPIPPARLLSLFVCHSLYAWKQSVAYMRNSDDVVAPTKPQLMLIAASGCICTLRLLRQDWNSQTAVVNYTASNVTTSWHNRNVRIIRRIVITIGECDVLMFSIAFFLDHPRSGVVYNFGRICLSVCLSQTITSESLDV